MAIVESKIRNGNGITFTYVVDSPLDWSGITNSTYFKDLSDGLIYYKNNNGLIIGIYDIFTGGTVNGSTTFTQPLSASTLFVNGVQITGDTNFATNDLTFTANRTHNLNGNYLYMATDLSFSNLSSFLYLDNNELQIGNYKPTEGMYIDFSGNTAFVRSYLSHNIVTFNTGVGVIGSNFTVNDENTNQVSLIVKSQNDNNLFVSDPLNNRIGIGTNLPTEKLTVSGNTNISGTLNIGTMGVGSPIFNLGLDSNGYVVSGVTGNLLYSQTDNYISNIPITINHNLNTTDVLVQIIDTNTNELIYGSVDNYLSNSVDVTLNINLNNVKVIVVGSGTSSIPTQSIVYFMGHDSVSPVDSTNYYIGDYIGLAPLTTSSDSRRLIVQKTGKIKQVSIRRSITGTLGSSEFNTFTIKNVTQSTTSVITTNATFNSAANLNNFILSSPLSVNSGDKIEIIWTTPVFATNPTSVRHAFNVLLEY